MVYDTDMLKKSYHTHTYRCGHAVGTDEEYIQTAIQPGMTHLGFTDHTPYKVNHPTDRMDYETYPEYRDTLFSLKEKYKDQIEIAVGLEIEVYISEWEDLLRYRRELDYLIVGQHYIDFDALGGYFTYFVNDDDHLMTYVKRLEQACSHHLVDTIAHPDLVMYNYQHIHSEASKKAAERIADISLYYDIPLELNCGSGIRQGILDFQDGPRYRYPTREWFEVFAQKNCPIVIGLDTHDPKYHLTDELLNKALSVVEGLPLNFQLDYNPVAHAKKDKLKAIPFDPNL